MAVTVRGDVGLIRTHMAIYDLPDHVPIVIIGLRFIDPQRPTHPR